VCVSLFCRKWISVDGYYWNTAASHNLSSIFGNVACRLDPEYLESWDVWLLWPGTNYTETTKRSHMYSEGNGPRAFPHSAYCRVLLRPLRVNINKPRAVACERYHATIKFSWDVTRCSLVDRYQHSGATYCHLLQSKSAVTYVRFHVKSQLVLSDLSKIRMFRQIFVKPLNIKFYQWFSSCHM
jgi:hypothetical protein